MREAAVAEAVSGLCPPLNLRRSVVAGIALFVLGLVMGTVVSPWWFLLCSVFVIITVLAEWSSSDRI
jgi:diacylglycerol kinase